MEKTPITAKGSLLLPYALREKYGLLDGGLGLLIEHSEGILIKKLEPSFFDDFAGKYTDELPSNAEFQVWQDEEILADEVRIKTLP